MRAVLQHLTQPTVFPITLHKACDGSSDIVSAEVLWIGAWTASSEALVVEILLSDHVELFRSRTSEAAIVLFMGGWEPMLTDRSCSAAFLATHWAFHGTSLITDAGSSGFKGLFQVTSCLFLLSGMEAILVKENPNKCYVIMQCYLFIALIILFSTRIIFLEPNVVSSVFHILHYWWKWMWCIETATLVKREDFHPGDLILFSARFPVCVFECVQTACPYTFEYACVHNSKA